MTGAEAVDPRTVRAALFGDADGGARVEEMARALDEQDAARNLEEIGRFSAAAYSEIRGQLAETVDGMLDVQLGPLVVDAWSRWQKLNDAAKATTETPGRAELVTLDEQHIVAQRRPRVDILIDGVTVAALTFVLTLEFTVNALVAVVRQGKLVAVRCGTTVLTGTLGMEGCPRALKQCQRTIDLPLVVNLGPGVPLLPTR